MSVLDQILRVFGTNRVRLRWKWQALRAGLARRARGVANRGRALAYEHQICPDCGHPAARDERACPKCGRALYGVTAGKAARLWSWLVPEEAPVVTGVLLAACVGLFLVTFYRAKTFFGPDSAMAGTPAWGLVLYRYGSVGAWSVFEDGQWWRLVTAIFLHGDALHLLMNGVGLWVAGRAVEERFGRARALVAFVLTGVGGFAVSVAWRQAQGDPASSVGASGAIFGLIGLIVGHAARFRGRTAAELRARFVPWLIYGVILGFAFPRIDHAAHLGGLACGALLGLVLADRDQAHRLPARAWTVFAALALALVVAAFGMAAATEPPRVVL